MEQPSTRKQIHAPSSRYNQRHEVKHSFEPQTKHQIVAYFWRGGGRLKIPKSEPPSRKIWSNTTSQPLLDLEERHQP